VKLVQVNLQRGFGGGEIYTLFLGRALRELGQPFDLVVDRTAGWWQTHDTGAERIWPVASADEIATLPFARPAWLLDHGPERGDRQARLRAGGCRLAAFVHMPLYQRSAAPFAPYDRLFAVSAYVLAGLRDAGLTQAHPEPLYGLAHLDRPTSSSASASGSIVAGPRYDWDRRKVRDRLLGTLYPAWRAIAAKPEFARRPGLTLGVVSRLTPIKQFPELFARLLPALLDLPTVKLEIFGSGGFASVRDLRAALAPLGARVRWWGQQSDVRAVYRQLDWLLTGLPEKEALGLNVIEAQMCGTPVLAPAAPPFTETIADGRSGYLYPDPRTDGGNGFRHLVGDLVAGRRARPDPLLAADHLARFSAEAFRARVAGALASLDDLATQ